MLNKKLKLRKRFLIKRQLIIDRINKEKKINENLINILSSTNLIISLYISVKSEVNLTETSKFMHKNKKKIALPIIENKDMHLLFKEWKDGEVLQKGKYDIKIPINKNFLEPRVLVVPMVAFDIKKNRLGYGGGFYDKTISYLEKKNKILKFGIAFDEQESKSIPVNNFDKKMDVIFTQSRIII